MWPLRTRHRAISAAHAGEFEARGRPPSSAGGTTDQSVATARRSTASAVASSQKHNLILSQMQIPNLKPNQILKRAAVTELNSTGEPVPQPRWKDDRE
jgi:hypothetical protein